MSDLAVNVGARTMAPPPYRCTEVALWGFLVRYGRDRVQDACNAMFRDRSGGAVAYEPIGRRALLTVGAIGAIVSQRPEFAAQGSITEGHTAIWIPLKRTAGGGPKLAVWNPYIWVDNPISLVAGRTIFGYAKSWGTTSVITQPVTEHSVRATLDVLGGNNGESRSITRLLTIDHIEANPTKGTAHEITESLRTLLERAGTAAQRAIVVDDALEWLSELLEGAVPQVFCKSIPHPSGGHDDLVQICTADVTVHRCRGHAVFNDHTLTVTELDSDPLGVDLGIASQTLANGFRVTDMDMTLDAGRVLWEQRRP